LTLDEKKKKGKNTENPKAKLTGVVHTKTRRSKTRKLVIAENKNREGGVKKIGKERGIGG